jgi:hypothetical protein
MRLVLGMLKGGRPVKEIITDIEEIIRDNEEKDQKEEG